MFRLLPQNFWFELIIFIRMIYMYVMYKMMYSSLKAVFITYGIYYYDLLI